MKNLGRFRGADAPGIRCSPVGAADKLARSDEATVRIRLAKAV